MSGAVKNYDFGAKRHWRRWLWNGIVERLPVATRDASVIYLPGARDEERPLVWSLGFRNENLIGVERDPTVVKNMRKFGGLTAHGDFFDAVTYLSARRKMHVVYGDLCGGMRADHPLVIGAWIVSPYFSGTVFAFNFLRGRDDAAKFGALWEKHIKHCGVDIRKHRAAIMLYTTVLMLDEHASNEHPEIYPKSYGANRLHQISHLVSLLKPSFHTYHSDTEQPDGRVVRQEFDSVVFQNNLVPEGRETEYSKARADKLTASQVYLSEKDIKKQTRALRTSHSLAATLAAATRQR